MSSQTDQTRTQPSKQNTRNHSTLSITIPVLSVVHLSLKSDPSLTNPELGILGSVFSNDGNSKLATEKAPVYHERQRLQFCLLHCLNNLFQQKEAFTRESLNSIAEKLVHDDPTKESWTPLALLSRPHHNTITGNYDINVLMVALEGKGKSVVWHDRRNGASSIDLDGPYNILMGIVLNVPVKRYAGLWRSRHWIALRRIDGVWYNLDSDLGAPQSFKDSEGVRGFLNYIIDHGGEILLVMNTQ